MQCTHHAARRPRSSSRPAPAKGLRCCRWRRSVPVVTPEANKCWHFRYRLHGKQLPISLGRHPDVTLQQAWQQTASYRTLVGDGADPHAKRRIDRRRADASDDRRFRTASERGYKSKQDAGLSASTLGKLRTYRDKDRRPDCSAAPLGSLGQRGTSFAEHLTVFRQ